MHMSLQVGCYRAYAMCAETFMLRNIQSIILGAYRGCKKRSESYVLHNALQLHAQRRHSPGDIQYERQSGKTEEYHQLAVEVQSLCTGLLASWSVSNLVIVNVSSVGPGGGRHDDSRIAIW